MFRRIVQNVFFVMVISLTVLAQTQPAASPQEQAGKTSIVIDRQLVRFLTAGQAQEWRLEVGDHPGAIIFDSGPTYGAALEWPLQNNQGEAVASGLHIISQARFPHIEKNMKQRECICVRAAHSQQP